MSDKLTDANLQELTFNAQVTVHVKNVAPRIIVGNIENAKHVRNQSFLSVTYEGEFISNGGFTMFLDYNSAKSLAESVVAKLEEMKYRD